MKLSQLESLLKCSESYEFKKQSLYLHDERVKFLLQAKEEFKKSLLVRKYEDFWSFFSSSYSDGWFPTVYTHKYFLERDTALFQRIIDFVDECRITIMEIDKSFSFTLNAEIFEGNRKEVRDKVDIVAAADNSEETLLINLDMLHNPYLSDRARMEHKKPQNSIMLAGIMLGLGNEYRGASAQIWFLNGRDDKDKSFPKFSLKSNISRYEFSSFFNGRCLNMDHLKSHIEDHILRIHIEKDCSKCSHNKICKSYRFDAGCQATGSTSTVQKSMTGKISYTEKQLQVIRHMDGPMNVIAVPGAGKTSALVERLNFLVKEKHVPPEDILFVSFTNSACREIKERVRDMLPNIMTFNSLGYKILCENKEILGDIRLITDVDKKNILLSALNRVPAIADVSYAYIFGSYGLLNKASRWIDDIDKLGREKYFTVNNDKFDVNAVLKFYDFYKDETKKRRYITYDEQVSMVNELFSAYPKLLERYSKQYQYIMVDEFQDTCEEQAEMIFSLASRHHNIVTVGDDDQNIFRFRGGTNKFMLHFKDYFPEATEVIMNDNFRSNDKILDLSNKLISGNINRIGKEMIGHKAAKHKPLLIEDISINVLINYLNELTKVYKPSDIAIISRKNSSLFDLKHKLAGFHTANNPKDYLIQDPVFLLIYDILSLYFDGMDQDIPLYRLFKSRGIKMKGEHGMSMYQSLLKNGLKPIEKDNPMSYYKYQQYDGKNDEMECAKKIFECFKAVQDNTSLSFIKNIAEIWIPEPSCNHMEAVSAMESICEPKKITGAYEFYRLAGQLIKFEDTERIKYHAPENAIQLLTSHDAKGQEFDVVIVYGIDEFDVSEEERRALYVSMTRARKTLILTTLSKARKEYVKEIQEKLA